MRRQPDGRAWSLPSTSPMIAGRARHRPRVDSRLRCRRAGLGCVLPRSGNTLTLLIIRDVFGVKDLGRVVVEDLDLGHAVRQAPDRSPSRPPSDLHGLRGKDLLEAIRDRPEPFFIKTHRLVKAADAAPALVVVRDGRDANVSYAHLLGSRRPHPAPERLPRPEGGDLAEERYRTLPFDQRLAQADRARNPGLRPLVAKCPPLAEPQLRQPFSCATRSWSAIRPGR